MIAVMACNAGCAVKMHNRGAYVASDAAAIEAAALATRLLGSSAHSFRFETIEAANEKDVFELESIAGDVVIRGNNGVSMASGLHWYLKHYCKCQVSLNYNRVVLPDSLPLIEAKIRKETPFAYRNFFNICAFGYTMPWWDWSRWEQLIDYMALHGVNMPLAITGQEAVWQEVFLDLGLTQQQIDDFLVGPCYLPWGWMGNIDGLCGPLPQGWIDNQKKLQQKILARQRALGMTPILQGFAGHVPAAIKEKYPEAKIHQTTDWAGMPGTYFLDPLDPLFKEIGANFIKKQTELYGTDHLYDADCFNEVNPHTNDVEFISEIGKNVYGAMLARFSRQALNHQPGMASALKLRIFSG
jgi:alpha-N-acetylglucosaminidase